MTSLSSAYSTIENKTINTLVREVNGLGTLRIPFVLIVDFDIKNYYLCPLEELMHSNELMIQFPRFSNVFQYPSLKSFILKQKKTSFKKYKQAYDIILQHLHQGNSFLVNLTGSTPVHVEGTLKDLFYKAHAPYKLWFKGQWVCFSPETFIKIVRNKIYAFPMKGTIDAKIPSSKKLLLENKKETAEHYTIVDLIRNDLNLISTDVKVEKFRYIRKIKTSGKDLLQASSKISGTLSKDFHRKLGEILISLLPAGSISGAPKSKTVEIIHEAEKHQRGFYTGVCFVYDGQGLDSCVLIRFVQKSGRGYVYKSGGGITIHSDVKQEFQELLDKIYVPAV
ncbi:MAG: aminodeoxychorismate synthase component I [Saprospiraceae bacterium]